MRLQDIIEQNLVKPLDFLAEDKDLCLQVQLRLQALGLLPKNGADGIFGNQTRKAFHQFKILFNQSEPDKIGPGSAKLLIETKDLPAIEINYNKIPSEWRHVSSPYLPTLVKAFYSQGLNDVHILAYACATICFESSWNPNAVNTTDAASKTGYPGAGLAQITWKTNYEAVGRETGINFVQHPNYMFDPEKALKAKAAFYKINGMIPYIAQGNYESAAGIYNAGRASFRSSYTRKVAKAVPLWLPVFL